MDIVTLGFALAGVFIFFSFVFGSLFTVEQQTVRFVERFGKFNKIGTPGLNFKIPFIDSVSQAFDMRLQQSNVAVETKTKDNVFVTLAVSIQYEVIKEKAFDAFYRLQDPKKQLGSYVFDTIRAQVPVLTLDEVFEKKDDIAQAVSEGLEAIMTTFGYNIEKTLVTDISPDEKVREAMNEINAASRLQVAATSKGEADKILVVKKAEAESESKRLQGEGIAAERAAIVEGLKTSVADMGETLKINPTEVMAVLMLTQWLDTMRAIGTNNTTNTILLPNTPDAMATIMAGIRGAINAPINTEIIV